MYVCLISVSVCDMNRGARDWGGLSWGPTRSRTLLFGFIACLYEFVAAVVYGMMETVCRYDGCEIRL